MSNPVFLLDAGNDPFEVMAIIKDYYNMSFRDARDFVTGAPSELSELDDSRFNEMLRALIAAGAKVGGKDDDVAQPEPEPEVVVEEEQPEALSVSMADILLGNEQAHNSESEDEEDDDEDEEYDGDDAVRCISIGELTPYLIRNHDKALKAIQDFFGYDKNEAQEVLDSVPADYYIPEDADIEYDFNILDKAGFEYDIYYDAPPEEEDYDGDDKVRCISITGMSPLLKQQRSKAIRAIEQFFNFDHEDAESVVDDIPSDYYIPEDDGNEYDLSILDDAGFKYKIYYDAPAEESDEDDDDENEDLLEDLISDLVDEDDDFEQDEYVPAYKDFSYGYINITGMTPELDAVKLLAIKHIKEIFNLGLKEAKDIVDGIPCKVGIPPTGGPQVLVALKEAGFIFEVSLGN